MKLLLFILGFVAVGGFAPVIQRCCKVDTTELRMGLFDQLFKPVHGHGSGEKNLDEIFKEEQELLKERKAHYSKTQLKNKYAPKSSSNWLDQLFSQPLHGHGSGEHDMEKMYQDQQKILYERREYINKDALKKKYKKTGVDHLNEIKTIADDPADLNKKEDDAMYIDETGGFQFPWSKKLKP
jgi:hypothetical protein